MQKKHQYRLVAMILAAVFVFEAMPLGAMATGGSGGVDLAAAYTYIYWGAAQRQP